MWHLLMAIGLTLMAWPAEPTRAATLAETDAGDLPATAQSAKGPAIGTPLEAITGTIDSKSDQDMFRILITDPEGFSASTDNSATTVIDTMLYLFNENGRGVLAADDLEMNDMSSIPAGSLAGAQSGIYLLAASAYYNTPQSPAGEIFELDALGGAQAPVGPDGPGRNLPVSAWDEFPDPEEQTGSYRIELTGATFVAVPEPTAHLLLATALASVAALTRQTRRRGA